MADHLGERENYSRISNEILDALTRAKLNGTQYALCLAVCRYTYGFNRCQAEMSASFLNEQTGLNIRQVKRELKDLILRNIIINHEEHNNSTSILGMNKETTAWVVSKKTLVTNQTLVSKKTLALVSNPTPEVVSNPTPKKRKLKQKLLNEKYILSSQEVFDHWNQQGIVIHQQINGQMNAAITKAVKAYGVDKVKEAISRYAKAYYDPEYYFKYKWTLLNFLVRARGLPDFLDGGEKWLNYQAKSRGRPEPDRAFNKFAQKGDSRREYNKFAEPYNRRT